MMPSLLNPEWRTAESERWSPRCYTNGKIFFVNKLDSDATGDERTETPLQKATVKVPFANVSTQ